MEDGLGSAVNFFHLDCLASEVRLDRRSHNPTLREAALDRDAPAIPWLQERRVRFVYS